MRNELAAAITVEMLQEHGLDDWSFRFDRALRRFGACFYRQRRISLSRAFVENNDRAVVVDTIRHEVAHALAWKHDRATGHGESWRKWCRATGAKPKRCYDDDEVVLPEPRYHCTVLATEVQWSRGSGASLQTGTARTSRRKGDVFGRHRLTKRLRAAVEVGLVSVHDSRTGRWVGS